MERVMKVRDLMLEAMAKKITWRPTRGAYQGVNPRGAAPTDLARTGQRAATGCLQRVLAPISSKTDAKQRGLSTSTIR